MQESKPRRDRKPAGPTFIGKPRNPVRELILFILLALCLALLLRAYVFTLTSVSGVSMQPNLAEGERLLVDKLSKRWRLPRAGELVVVVDPQDPQRDLVKRVVGLPGDQVAVLDGVLQLNGRPVMEGYIREVMDRDVPTVTVSPHSVFVLGDNRNNSLDSRAFGPVAEEKILGRVLLRLWPLTWFKRPPVWVGQDVPAT